MMAASRAWREKTQSETEAIKARTKAMRDKRVEANSNAGLKETVVCQVTTEASPMETNPEAVASRECEEQYPRELESGAEHQEVLKEEAAVRSSRAMKKRHRGRRIAAGRRDKPKELTEVIVNPGGGWLPPAGRCPAVQKWHGGRGTFLGKFGPR
jgi:hypothetical protein